MYCKPSKFAWGVVALACALGIGALSSCTMPALTQVSSQAFPAPMTCGDCHVEIYDEWRKSPHALSFTNERFRRATDDYRFTQCLGCHAPQPEMVKAEPVARVADREIGVACVACHLDHGALVGPLEPTGFARPHPIRVDREPFENGTLCGNCHQGTLKQWQAAELPDKQDCRQCHMPGVERKITQSTGLVSRPIVAAEDVAPQHRHSFRLVPGDVAGDRLKLSVSVTDRILTVDLKNEIPHHLPTGDFGVRIVKITVMGISAGGASTVLGQWELSNSGNRALPAGQSRKWSMPVDPSVVRATVIVEREGRDGSNRAELAQSEVVIP